MAKLRHEIESLNMDFQNLLSCIECHKEGKNVAVIIETLNTIVSICAEEKLGKDVFRDAGGLDFLLQFLINTDETLILEHSLKVLAFVIDGNVHSQMHLTQEKVFTILQAVFDKKTYPLSVVKNSVVLLSTILFQNRTAQDLIYKNECLLSLINLYKYFFPTSDTSPEDSDHLETWLNINSSLCFAANNPMNDKNQEMCSALFPLSLRIIETFSNPAIIDASSSFLSLSIANNEKNQTTFSELDGFLILKRSLNKTFEQIQTYIKECNNFISKGCLQITNSLMSVISASVLDHEENAALCGKLGIMSMMISLLSTGVLNSDIVKKIILALGNCIEAYSKNSFILFDTPNFDILLRKNLEPNDEELHSAVRYLLQICLREFNTDQEQMSHTKDIGFSNENLFGLSHERISNLVENENKFAIPSGNGWGNQHPGFYVSNSQIPQGGASCHESFQEQIGTNINLKSKNLKPRNNSAEFSLTEDKILCLKNQHVSERNIHERVDTCLQDDRNFESSSQSNCSLQSAGHLYRQQKKKNKRIHKNIWSFDLEEYKIVRNGNFCSSDEECNLSICSKTNYNNTRKVFDKSEQNITENNHCESNNCMQINSRYGCEKKGCMKTKNKNGTPEKRKSRASNDLKNFSKINNKCNSNFTTLASSDNEELAPKRNFMNATNKSDNLKFDEIRASEKESRAKDLSLENSASKFNFTSSGKRVTNTINQHTDIGELSDKHCSFKLQGFSRPYSSINKKSQRTPESESSCSTLFPLNSPGCIEIIVLPGATCCEHKLAAQFELLKVCSVSNI